MRCYHHNDMDGKAAGYEVYKWATREFIDCTRSDFKMKTYDDPFDLDNKDHIVFIVDLSFTKDTVEKLYKICEEAKQVIWIDHHASSQNIIPLIKEFKKSRGNNDNLTYLISMDACGALLTKVFLDNVDFNNIWNGDFIHEDLKFSKSNEIEAYTYCIIDSDHHLRSSIKNSQYIIYVDDYDRWVKQYQETDYMILGAECYNTSLFIKNKSTNSYEINSFWDRLDNSKQFTLKLINDGKTIQRYLNSRYHRELRNCFTITINGYRVLVKNALGNSTNFCEKIKDYDAVCIFFYDGFNKVWKHSIYADENSNIDCSVIAEFYGGGGHKKAAGFSSNDVLFYPNGVYTTDNENGKWEAYYD